MGKSVVNIHIFCNEYLVDTPEKALRLLTELNMPVYNNTCVRFFGFGESVFIANEKSELTLEYLNEK